MEERDLVVVMKMIDSVKKFVNVTSSSVCVVDVQSGKYLVDGKSLLGLLAMDLSKQVTVHIYGDCKDDVNKLAYEIEQLGIVQAN